MVHLYLPSCGCPKCEHETALQRNLWNEALDLCKRHNGITDDAPCEICLDVTTGAASEDPLLHALGVTLARLVRNQFAK
jgi:hypothetical protein